MSGRNCMTRDKIIARMVLLETKLKLLRGHTHWFKNMGWRPPNDIRTIEELIRRVRKDNDHYYSMNVRHYMEDCNYVWKKLHEQR